MFADDHHLRSVLHQLQAQLRTVRTEFSSQTDHRPVHWSADVEAVVGVEDPRVQFEHVDEGLAGLSPLTYCPSGHASQFAPANPGKQTARSNNGQAFLWVRSYSASCGGRRP